MPHVVEHCSAHFGGIHVGNGVLLIAEAIVGKLQLYACCREALHCIRLQHRIM